MANRDFKVGDTVKVSLRIKEGEKERIQVYEGLVIGIQGGGGNDVLLGDGGVDTVSGGGGRDLVIGGANSATAMATPMKPMRTNRGAPTRWM